MFRREILRVTLWGGAGCLLALALGPRAWLMPLCCVGLRYALPVLACLLLSFWRMCGQAWFFSLVLGRWLALLLMPFLALAGLLLTLSVGWLPGLFLAIRALALAWLHDSDNWRSL